MNFCSIFSYLLISGYLFASSVNMYNAEIVARNLYSMQRTNDFQKELIVSSIEVIKVDSNELIYIFHLVPNGFIMISADDRSTPILAYSFKNSFKLNGMPPNVSWIIQQYKNNIKDIITTNFPKNNFITTQWNKFLNENVLERQQGDAVLPLLTAEFGQKDGWNNQCPSGCPGEEALVGCVAVSISQIMHYWKYPLQGEGNTTYIDPEGDESSFGTLFADFSNSTYDYSEMGDGTTPSEAAALLLYDAGVSVGMDYGCDESGAQVAEYISGRPSAQNALKTYFKYDEDLSSYSKDIFDEDEFIDLIKEELDNHRPFIWSGYESSENGSFENGHAWVCDGYNEEDLFHMNWGWNSASNGWFYIDLLNPSGYKFDTNNSVLIGIRPPDGEIVSPMFLLESYSIYELDGDHDQVFNPGERVALEVEILNSPSWHDASSFELELITDESGISISDGIIIIGREGVWQQLTNGNWGYFEILNGIWVLQASVVFNEGPPVGEIIVPEGLDQLIGNWKEAIDDYSYEDLSGIGADEAELNVLPSGETYSNTAVPFLLNIDPSIILGNKVFTLQVSAIGLEGEQFNSFLHEYKIEFNVSLNQSGFPVPATHIRSSPLVIDLDCDGDLEIIIGDKNGFVRIYNADGSEVQNEIFPFFTGVGNEIWGSAAAADIDRDGLTDFVITTKSEHLYIFDKNGLKTDYNANNYLIGTPAIGNLDDDEELEIVFSSYSSNNKIFVINSDGTDVSGFPYELGEKVKAGVALADFNENGKDDIVLGTDDNYIHLIYDDGTEAPGFPYQTDNKIQIAPSILDINGEKVIFSGSGYESGITDKHFYAINSDGSIRFKIEANKTIITSPSFLTYNDNQYIFFGTLDSLIYAFDTAGNTVNGWPVNAGNPISKSIIFSDLDGDGEVEIIAANEASDIVAYSLDGTLHAGFPIDAHSAATSSPVAVDLDNDGDLEIIVGAADDLISIDIKSVGTNESYWNMYRGNLHRTGYSGTSPIGGYIPECPELSSNEDIDLPIDFKLNTLYPNPFNPITTISYSIPSFVHVKIEVYDIRGRLVDNILSRIQSPGDHSMNWNANTYPSGVYFISMEAGIFRETRKVLLIK